MIIKIDPEKITGKMKPVHGFNNAARITGYGKLLPEFEALHAPLIRLHDTCGEYGGKHYIDIPNIFPDFAADENCESSYDFALSDLYIKELVDSGSEVMFRLGVSIEHAPKKYDIYAPKDPKKWASICEHIVRHYNAGWNNGFFMNIRYWEIWNEPDGLDAKIEPYGPPMWIGTAREYYRLYSETARLIKEKHPEVLVGGYSSCYILGANVNGKWTEGPTDYFTGFLAYITAPETAAPLDFFSWHGYLGRDRLEKIGREFSFIKKTLSEYGLENVPVFDTEWNCNIATGEVDKDRTMYYINMRNEYGASHAAAALCEMQRLGVDAAMYYDAQLWCAYGALFNVPELTPTKTYYAFKAFSKLYELADACEIQNDTTVYTCAATDGKACRAIISNLKDSDFEIELQIDGFDCTSILLTSADGAELPVSRENGKFILPANSFVFVEAKARG